MQKIVRNEDMKEAGYINQDKGYSTFVVLIWNFSFLFLMIYGLDHFVLWTLVNTQQVAYHQQYISVLYSWSKALQ